MVGGMAVILYGHARVTGDMDIWVECSEKNYKKLEKTFHQFGMPLFDMTLQKFMNVKESDVFSFGRNPVGIDIMTAVKGLDFEESYALSTVFDDDGLQIRMIHINHLIEAKKAAGRLKDLDDIKQLQKKKKS
jgi:hypothetical protein